MEFTLHLNSIFFIEVPGSFLISRVNSYETNLKIILKGLLLKLVAEIIFFKSIY